MTPKESAFQKISALVERFSEQISSYKNSEYNETMTRRDFIDPFFKALGWDVDNEQAYAESYREVIHEDKVKIGSATKAPDYSFRLPGGKRLFFVEAKKPAIDIKEGVHTAYQVRRYGWSAKLPISVISDFEEFSIYDCTKKPRPDDKAAVARIRYILYTDYLKEFDFIWDTFSKEQVLKGSFDRFLQGTAHKKGTATVDREFLVSLDNWRTVLASSISRNNQQLDEDELNYAVQQTLDRIIFLRIAEDRGIEPYGTLKTVLQQNDYYQGLFGIFKTADEKYNSGLFDFKKDKLSQNLVIDNKAIKTIINELYYPVSPYEFSVLSVEILGSAYEQFLGKVIRVTPAHYVKIEEKPEVRKAGGVYYTPQYIVDYIVQNTVGKLIEDKSPEQVSEIKICDPACGSGSFLIGAYQYLLDWHKSYYNNKYKSSKGRKDSPLTPDGNLTTAEKKRILLNNIYGVDIDMNAVEVTKLSLLLKCLEGETEASIKNQLSMFHERVLPTLDHNIKDGNSLIDVDFYDSQLDFGDEKKIKPFNWQKAFPEVFKPRKKEKDADLKLTAKQAKEHAQKALEYVSKLEAQINKAGEPDAIYESGGFDVVIGNPPYLGGRDWKEENGNAYDYFMSKFQVAEYQFDIYALFWEAGIKLLNSNGTIGFITPNTWLNNQSNKKLRTYILNHTHISKIVDYSKVKVFDQATVLPIITILEKNIKNDSVTEIFEPVSDGFIVIQSINQNIWNDKDLNIININLSQSDLLLRAKIERNSQALLTFALVKRGIQLYETGKGIPKQKASDAKDRVYEASIKVDDTYIKFLEGKDIFPYYHSWKNRWIKYGENLAARRDPTLFEGERFAVRRIVGATLIATYFSEKIGISQLLHIVKPFNAENTKFLLGIVNSKLISFYFRKKYNRQDKTFPEIRIYELASLPIKQVNDLNKSLKNEIDNLVDQLLKLNEEKQQAKLESRLNQIQSKIDYCEDRINQIVYQLYGLTEEEIKIVEGKE